MKNLRGLMIPSWFWRILKNKRLNCHIIQVISVFLILFSLDMLNIYNFGILIDYKQYSYSIGGIGGSSNGEEVDTSSRIRSRHTSISWAWINTALSFLKERLQQYKLIEMKLISKQSDLQAKIPALRSM